MDFELKEEQRDIQNAAREFAKGEFDKRIALEHDKGQKWPSELVKKAADLGFIGVHFDKAYGGQDLGILENALIVEEFCRADSGLGTCMFITKFASEIILRCGSPEQKEKWLPLVTKGAAVSCGAFTEPDHGSDITSMSTTAKKTGDEYLINGSKNFISNGTIADFAIVLCRTDPNASPAYRGLSAILVESDREGYSSAEIEDKMGIRMTRTAELSFDEVRVPKSNIIGKENRGFYQTLEFFDESRIEIAAQALGIAQGAFDRALAYSVQREQFGQRLADFQVTQHKLADMATKLEAARLLTYKAAWNFDQGRIDPRLTSIAKLYAARTAVEVAEESIQIHGGYGYILEYEVERFYRDARVTEIYEGTREVQKNTIASEILRKLK
jgi:alkylation response protein AidB-like acyl-CoA dehydrogenase